MTSDRSRAPLDCITDVVGETPVVRLRRFGDDLAPSLFAKLELLNPGGSAKDRIALQMLGAAETRGAVAPGATLVEPTSGNTGVGLAIAAAVRGYRAIFVMPDKVSRDKRSVLRAYGAEVVICPTDAPPDDPSSYYRVADRLTAEIPGAVQLNQYANQDNPEAHYRATGPEIWNQLGCDVDAFVAGIGTGGTISGVGRFLKERDPGVLVVGADPAGSVYSGDVPRPYLVEGVGEDFIPTTYDESVVDRVVRVDDETSFLAARDLARMEGILAGGSSGTALAAARVVAADLPRGSRIVVLLPDTGRNYLSQFYDDAWFAEKFPQPNGRPLRRVASASSTAGCRPIEPGHQGLSDLDGGAEGYVVVDTVMEGRAMGGMRATPSVTAPEIGDLARKMTAKLALARVPIGGAKAGLRIPEGCSRERRSHILTSAGRALAPLLHSGLYLGCDQGISYEDREVIFHAARYDPAGELGYDWSWLDLWKQCEGVTGFGVVEVVDALVAAGACPPATTVSIQGFGVVGRGVARALQARGHTIVAAADRLGTLTAPDGLDLDALVEATDEAGTIARARLTQDGLAVEGGTWLDTPAEMLVLAAGGAAITTGNAELVQARIVVEAANSPVTAGARRALTERGVVVVPDVVANSGAATVTGLALTRLMPRAEVDAVVSWAHAEVSRRLRAAAHDVADLSRHDMVPLWEAAERLVTLRRSGPELVDVDGAEATECVETTA